LGNDINNPELDDPISQLIAANGRVFESPEIFLAHSTEVAHVLFIHSPAVL